MENGNCQFSLFSISYFSFSIYLFVLRLLKTNIKVNLFCNAGNPGCKIRQFTYVISGN